MNTGNAGYNNFRKLNSTFLRNDAENYNDKKLPINTTTENNAAPIELSVIILVCLGTIILGLYVASYTIENFTVFKELICGRNTNKRNWFDRNGAVTSKFSTLSMEILSLYAIVFVVFFLNFHNVSYFIIKTVTYIAVIQCM